MNLSDELAQYAGLGRSKARDLISRGLKSVAQLNESPWFESLPIQTQTVLINDPNRKIPREHIDILASHFRLRGTKIVIVGSYRRKAPFSRDIDLMLVSDKPAIEKYLTHLNEKFTCIVYSIGPTKMSLVFDPSPGLGHQSSFYKIDVFLTPKKYEPAMLLYATGSKVFNIRMRARAKSMGYLLNQYGLFSKKTGAAILVGSEKEFFAKLEMAYVAPSKR